MAQDVIPKVVQDCHLFLVWMIPHLDRFPRSRRFTLGERIERILLEVLELLVDAAYRPDKLEALRAANRKIEVLRHLWRAAYELEVLSVKPYGQGAKQLETIGRQIGGWLRSREGGS